MDKNEDPANHSLNTVTAKLEAVLATLEECAQILSTTGFGKERGHVKTIGRAMSEIGKIQRHIWDVRPDLRPEYTEQGWGRPPARE